MLRYSNGYRNQSPEPTFDGRRHRADTRFLDLHEAFVSILNQQPPTIVIIILDTPCNQTSLELCILLDLL